MSAEKEVQELLAKYGSYCS